MNTSNADLLSILGKYTVLKRKCNTHGGEYSGPCPFCRAGEDRFLVWPYQKSGGRYWCRVCGKNGDAITLLQQLHNVSFNDACSMLGISPSLLRTKDHLLKQSSCRPLDRSGTRSRISKSENPAWQRGAHQMIADSRHYLYEKRGSDGLLYMKSRGIDESVLRAFSIGFQPAPYRETWGDAQIRLPNGIVLPCFDKEAVSYIKVRPIHAQGAKYLQAAGGKSALYNGSSIRPGCTVILVEGEIDALSLVPSNVNAIGACDCVPVATGSSTGSRSTESLLMVAHAAHVLLSFDNDQAGENAAAWWGEMLGTKAIRWAPTRHDINEMLVAGEDLGAWLSEGIDAAKKKMRNSMIFLNHPDSAA